MLGVAAATAVLTGALIVGDSMRQSLRSLTIERLGKIDEMLMSDGFFRSKLANEIQTTKPFQEYYQSAVPAILFPGGTVETKIPVQKDNGSAPKESANAVAGSSAEVESMIESVVARANQVTVLGIAPEFWKLGDVDIAPPNELGESEVAINQTLAQELGITPAMVTARQANVTLRIPKRNQLPGDSAMSKKNDLIDSLVDLNVVHIVPTTSLGRFGMHPTQSDPLNLYLPIGLLQESLSYTILSHKTDTDQANVIFLSGKNATPLDFEQTAQLRRELQPTLADYGLLLTEVKLKFELPENKHDNTAENTGTDGDSTVFDYWSLASERMVFSDAEVSVIRSALPAAKPVFTYLANDIRRAGTKSGVPFSMISAIDFDETFQPLSAASGQAIGALADDEIVLNEWAANDLGAKLGDRLTVTYFEPETTHGNQVEKTAELKLVDVAKFTEPVSPYVVKRRGKIERAKFETRPEVTNDPDLTPAVPGITDAESIDNWDLPFDTASTIRSQDDDYWSNHRTTPKAFVSPATGKKLWNSRFGHVTSFRIPKQAKPISNQLLNAIASGQQDFGLQIVSIKQRGLAASSGSTPFDALFLALSMFVIVSAMILVALLFRLSFEQRAAEVGLMSAIGFSQSRLRRVWLMEMLFVSLVGGLIGILLGVGYAGLMIWGLTTVWVGAISKPFLQLHVTPISLLIGMVSGVLVCLVTIAWSLRRTCRANVTALLAGNLESQVRMKSGSLKNLNLKVGSRISGFSWLAIFFLCLAIGLAVMATKLAGEAQAGSFLGAGFLVLAALLILVHQWLRRSLPHPEGLTLSGLALANAKRNPLRSTLTIGLVAVASFLIAAVSAFRLAPTEQGTGGFTWVAHSSQPILEDLTTPAGRRTTLGLKEDIAANNTDPMTVFSLRYKSGEDASCNNLYQSTQPQVLGVSPAFVEHFRDSTTAFAWAGSLAATELEKSNPWELLSSEKPHRGTPTDPIPVVIDKNTANYSLKIFSTGAVFPVSYDSGETIHFRVIGFLANTILQGSLIVSEKDFVTAFPAIGGYQYFLISDQPPKAKTETSVSKSNAATQTNANTKTGVQMMEQHLSDYGFDARSAHDILASFMTVQNTYLSTFQTLGALGLLLGTFGLAAVQWRSVLERRRELGLMRAVGFGGSRLGTMIFLENGSLLVGGLIVGILSALFTTVPHWLIGNASVPWLSLLIMFGAILAVGIFAGWLAARQIGRLPLLESLRSH